MTLTLWCVHQAHLDSKGKSKALASFFEQLHGWTQNCELDEGAALLIRGALRHVDVRRCYSAQNPPTVKHLFVASTQNVFISANQTNSLVEALGGSRVAEITIEECCARKGEFAAHVALLKAGHAILQVLFI